MTRIFSVAAFAAFFLFANSLTLALGPHECALLVNRNSPDSMALANFYADLRKIPLQNIIYLDIPAKALAPAATITPDEFRRHIYEPAMNILASRNLPGHVLVWLYSLDFPSTVATDPPMSLTGMTFVRGQPPSGEEIMSGKWPSRLFRGPDRPDGPAAPSLSLEQFTLQLTTNMPLPSMMLGWSGSRGMTLDEIKEHLRIAASSDGSHPNASMYFELNDNVRSTSRQWQFDPAIRELVARKFQAVAASNQTEHANVMGVMAGRPVLDPQQFGPLRPGAYADHLTSFGALFHEGSQTKLTAWLRAGAAASSGTVVEPGSTTVSVILWTKFPTARLYTHYTGGNTMIESLYQSIRSPLQILLVGDALCAPWSKSPGLTLISLADDDQAPVRGRADFMTSTWTDAAGTKPPLIMYLLNGQPVMSAGGKPTSQLTIDTTRLPDGYHELRAIGYLHEPIRQQGFAGKGFVVRNHDRSVALSGYPSKATVDMYHPLSFTVTAEGEPVEVAVFAQECELIRKPYATDMKVEVSPDLTGAGPVSFHAVAFYKNREAVRSAPLPLEIRVLNRAPSIDFIETVTNDQQFVVTTMRTSDPEGDPVSGFWAIDWLSRQDATLDAPHRIKEIQSSFQFTDTGEIKEGHQAGIVFNQTDEQNYLIWGADGGTSAWSLKRVQDGVETIIFARGAPLESRRNYSLRLAVLESGRMNLMVNDALIGTVDLSFGPGKVGVRTASARVAFEHLLISPTYAARPDFREEEDRLMRDLKAPADFAIFAMARDHRATSLKPVQGVASAAGTPD